MNYAAPPPDQQRHAMGSQTDFSATPDPRPQQATDPESTSKLEKALKASEARAKAISEGVDVAVLTLDESGAIRAANTAASEIFGYAAQELQGGNVTALTSSWDELKRELQSRPQSDARAQEKRAALAVEGRRKDGSSFPAEAMASKIGESDTACFILVLRDLSERRRFEARLQRLHLDRLGSMSEMATALAHEVNQPLAAAATYLRAARRMLNADPDRPAPRNVVDAFEKAADQMLRAGRIIGNLREFIGGGEPDKTEQSLHALIRQACDLMLPDGRFPDIRLDLRLDAAMDTVLVDRVQLIQALVNLIRNAKDAMADVATREITISTSLADGAIHTEVSDTGRGLPSVDGKDLFEPFTSTKPDGLGVGLPISKSIIEAHYGTIAARNNPSGGATIGFQLPLMEKTAE
jgi:PAS domain S-box-containing protein